MKNILVGFALFLCVSHSHACDICGSASSAFSLGMLPNSKQHFVGLRSTMRWYESEPAPDGHEFRGVSSQFFTSTEIFGRYKISKRFQLQGFVPYVVNQKTDSKTTTINGIGDVMLIGNFVFVDNMDSIQKKVRHSGTIGLGVKAPTGQFFKLGFEEINMLPGTGAVDFIANLNYLFQLQNNIGFQNETSFTYKLTNKYQYRFGNALSISQVIFYRWKINETFSIVPQLGAQWMHNWKDLKNGQLSEDTYNGGSLVNGQASIFFMWKSWGLNIQGQLPIYQQLNRGYVSQLGMVRCAVNYFMNSKR